MSTLSDRFCMVDYLRFGMTKVVVRTDAVLMTPNGEFRDQAIFKFRFGIAYSTPSSTAGITDQLDELPVTHNTESR